MAKLFWKKMQKKCILVYFVKSGPQNTTDSNKIIIIFIKIDERLSQAARPKNIVKTFKT
jgi:hypothetical protein